MPPKLSQRIPQHKRYTPLPFPGTAAFHLASGFTQLDERTPRFKGSRSGSTREHAAETFVPGEIPGPFTNTQPQAQNMAHLTPQSIDTPQHSVPGFSPVPASDMAEPASSALATPTPLPLQYEMLQPELHTAAMGELRDPSMYLFGIGAAFEGIGMRERELEFQLDQYKHSAADEQDDLLWKKILATNMSLLERYHDFFAVSEDSNAPEALKYLAGSFGMPTRMWEKGFQETLEVLRDQLPRTGTNMKTMLYLASATLQKLSVEFPHMQHQWELIDFNLKEYLLALRKDGIDLGFSSDDCLEIKEFETVSSKQLLSENNRGMMPVGDDPDFEWFFRERLSSVLGGKSFGCKRPLAKWRICEAAQLLMSGWLYYGRRMSRHNFHSFIQLFIFLGLAGADAFCVG